ncbi:hypothetical protein F4808DRAFT_458480 [Astrocystis sublimbata]|nr:hypothetical protein F4808DRAFT_458480 [Astrocystis sublimbata]
MPDEEMDMAVDFGQAGFGEDIDIDLDFPAAEPDDDMDLGDFDGAHDLEHFNTDTRDEMMAEGDDASYGMIDAVEVDHADLAAADNDIDVEVEQAVQDIWQQNGSHSVDANLDTDIDYLDETTAENMDADNDDVETGGWLPALPSVLDTTDVLAKGAVDGVAFEVLSVPQESYEEPVQEEASHNNAESTRSPVVSALTEARQSEPGNELTEDGIIDEAAQTSDQLPTVTENHQGVEPSDTAVPESNNPSLNLQEEPNEQHETSDFHTTTQTGSDHNDEPFVLPNPEHVESPEITQLSNEKTHDAELLRPAEEGEFADDTSEYQLNGLYDDHTNDHIGDDVDGTAQNEPLDNKSYSQVPEASPAPEGRDPQHEGKSTTDSHTPLAAASVGDDPFEMADHYGIYITYGETNYRLFAKSEDDDPNQYFLTDKSALNFSLTRFLASLRDVISEEVSPLDDLVMHVDCLGIEFSESTTSDFLDKFTFGDLVVLHDKLVKNEESESSPSIHTYLTVRPNCVRRMMALAESANAGRGLSEVALYRESSIDDDGVDDVESLDTDISDYDHNDGDSESIHQQDDYEEGDAVNDSEQRNSPSVAVEAQSEHNWDNSVDDPNSEESQDLDQDKSADGSNSEEHRNSDQERSADDPDNKHHEIDQGQSNDNFVDTENHNALDDTIDTVDQQDSIPKQSICPLISQYLFLSTRKSTCACEDCYEFELEQLATPGNAEVRLNPGATVPLHHLPMHRDWETDYETIEDYTTNEDPISQPLEGNGNRLPSSPKSSEASEPKPAASQGSLANTSNDGPNSENTSVSATLAGEEHDEIDYHSEDDNDRYDDVIDESNALGENASVHELTTMDDEITWESDAEDGEVNNETKDGLVQDAAQVSPVSLKRTRSELGALDGAGDENDNKRHRS